ncbi:unnamed protein product [Prunus brigantina]
MVCDSKFSNWVRDQAALVVLGLIKFNKDVFVGLVRMGPIVRALIQMVSSCSIQVLTGLVKIIRTPLVDDINGEIPRIISLLGSEDLSTKVAAMNCILEIVFLGREEVIGLMLDKDLIKKLMGVQRLEVGLQSKRTKWKCLCGGERAKNGGKCGEISIFKVWQVLQCKWKLGKDWSRVRKELLNWKY